jgi:hypothetical protein
MLQQSQSPLLLLCSWLRMLRQLAGCCSWQANQWCWKEL